MRLVRSMSFVFSIAMRFAIGLLTAAVIFWWMHALDKTANQAPRFSALKELNLTIPRGAEVVLGRAELLQTAGARSSELQHLRLRATQKGQLLISRVAEIRGLNVEFGGKTEEGSSEQYEIEQAPGSHTRISAGSQFLDISVLEDGGIEFEVEDGPGTLTSVAVYESGARTIVNGQPALGCYEQGLAGRIAMSANQLSRKVALSVSSMLEQRGLGSLFQQRGKSTIAIVGGGVNCSMFSHALIAMPRADQELEFTVRENLSDGRLFVSVHREAQLVPISYETWLDGHKIAQHYGRTGIEVAVASDLPLKNPTVTHFTAGKTRYSIDANNGADGVWGVQIRPDRRIALFDDKLCSQPSQSPADILSAEDCPPLLGSSPNLLTRGATIEVVKQARPASLDRLFVSSPDGLSSAEMLARGVAIAMSVLIILAVPGASMWHSNGSYIRGTILALAGGCVLGLCMFPDLVAIARIVTDVPMAAEWMFYALGGLWICATIVVTLDRSGGFHLSALWLVLTAIIALSSISMFSLSLEGPNTDWERFFIKHKLVVLDILPVFVIALTIVSPTALKLRIGNDFAGRPSLFSPIFWLLAIVLALFTAWFFLGNQTGLGGSIQPVEAGKFAIVVLLGAALAQWLIRARLLAQTWFGLTMIAVVLSGAFVVALLFVPAVKSDYSPLIIIASVTAITGVFGAMAIGWRIREEEIDDLKDIKRIPSSYMPTIRDVRLKPSRLVFLLVCFGALVVGPFAYLNVDISDISYVLNHLGVSEYVDISAREQEYLIAAAVMLALAGLMLTRLMTIPRALFIVLLGLPMGLVGAWALLRQEFIVLGIAVGSLVMISFSIAMTNRINWSFARLAIATPLIALALAVGLRDLPAKAGLGVKNWSWFDGPDQQITELEKVLGDGRRLPVERLMSWADLRYGGFDAHAQPRQLALRDMNFHVLRSRATLASAPCGLSAELIDAPYRIGQAVDWMSRRVSQGLGLTCSDKPAQAETLHCTPSSLKGPVRPHCVPVVQSDFAATYIVSRHGNSAAVLLVVLQGIFVVLVIELYLRLQSRRSRDPVETGADQALACIALGAGMLFLMQWILAWSNAFGLLPVMGQPMTWLSAGTSHHLFMAIPASLVLLVAARLAGMKDPVLTIRVPPRRRG